MIYITQKIDLNNLKYIYILLIFMTGLGKSITKSVGIELFMVEFFKLKINFKTMGITSLQYLD